METIDEVLLHQGRKIVVAMQEIDLTIHHTNEIFVLLVEESRGAAGGREGAHSRPRCAGSGSRRISRIIRFSCANGKCVNSFATDNPEIIQALDLPYSAVAMDIKLTGGQEIVVQGVVDPELVTSYVNYLENTN